MSGAENETRGRRVRSMCVLSVGDKTILKNDAKDRNTWHNLFSYFQGYGAKLQAKVHHEASFGASQTK